MEVLFDRDHRVSTRRRRTGIKCGHGTKEQYMPKIEIAAVPVRKGSGYPMPFDQP
jgi:hypothetical protein